jgi:hypothetical protein
MEHLRKVSSHLPVGLKAIAVYLPPQGESPPSRSILLGCADRASNCAASSSSRLELELFVGIAARLASPLFQGCEIRDQIRWEQHNNRHSGNAQ